MLMPVRRYSFCRVADDLIDDAPSNSEATQALDSLEQYLDHAYIKPGPATPELQAFVRTTFPDWTHPALLLLPTNLLPKGPLVELLEGFRTDLLFPTSSKVKSGSNGAPNGRTNGITNGAIKDGVSKTVAEPIKTEEDLLLYGRRVAGTVGELCNALVFAHAPASQVPPPATRDELGAAASRMGVALQCVNIARDVWVDARMEPAGRVYLPQQWLADAGIGTADVLDAAKAGAAGGGEAADPRVLEAVGNVRAKTLERAMELYGGSREAVERLPTAWGARKGVRVAVEAYMTIGRALRKRPKGLAPERWEVGSARRASVPVWKRLWVLWSTMARG
jgi:15-cis-phytoene synthase/lycopene beta-cyclase